MGHSPSKVSKTPLETFTPDVEVITKNHSTPFGEVTIVKDKKTNLEMYEKVVTLQTKESFEAQLDHFYKRVKNPHLNFVNVIGYTSDQIKSFCSEVYKINLYLDSHPRNLDVELNKRIQNNEWISEIELQLLAEQLINVLSSLQQKEIAHDDIRPENIFITEEAYKLYDPTFVQSTFASQVPSFMVHSKKLLAPEIVSQLHKEHPEAPADKFKASAFSLGATLLAVSTLSKSEDLYNYDEGTIDQSLLKLRLEKVESLYSPSFVKLLRDLLEVKPEKRPDFIELSSRLNIQVAIGNFYFTHINRSATKAPYVKVAEELGDVISSSTFVANGQMTPRKAQSRRTYSEVSIPQSRTNVETNNGSPSEAGVKKTYITIDNPAKMSENLRASQQLTHTEAAKKSAAPVTEYYAENYVTPQYYNTNAVQYQTTDDADAGYQTRTSGIYSK